MYRHFPKLQISEIKAFIKKKNKSKTLDLPRFVFSCSAFKGKNSLHSLFIHYSMKICSIVLLEHQHSKSGFV